MAIKIALAGNPNCGKTTMFNALTGANQYVGNWPGVTVEKKEGKLKTKGKHEDVIVTDLPGIYSMSPYTLEEVVSRDYVLKENPDVIVDLVDSTNIERNLYLTTQLIETGVPVVIALNMTDLLEKRGMKIDVARLSMLMNCPVVETCRRKSSQKIWRRLSLWLPRSFRRAFLLTKRDGTLSNSLRTTARLLRAWHFRHLQ